MIQGTSLKFYSKPWVFFPPNYGVKIQPSAGSKWPEPLRVPSATAFAYGGQRGRSNNWWFSVGQILYEWQEQPQEQQPTKNGGITEFLEVWILWMCCFFFFLKMGFHLLTSSLSRSEDRDGESALFTVKQKTHGHPAHLIFQTISDTPTYPLVICYIAIENGHRNSGFSH